MVVFDDVQIQLKILERLEAEGARFVPVRPGSKQPIGTGWQQNPHTADGVADHLYAGGNVGLLAGEASNGICVLDLDTQFPKFLTRFPKFAQTPRILRDGAPERGKVLVRIKEMVPPPRKWKNVITNMPEAEWLSTGNHALLPPSVHPNGNYFYWYNESEPILELTLAQMNLVWQQWTGTLLVPTPEAEAQGPTIWFPDPHAPRRTSRATPPSPTRTIMPPSDPRDTIRRRFDMVRYACQQLNTTSVRESATEFRVLGQGAC